MDLVLTLGHNSSAILIEDGVVLGGYEEERFSGLKADSSFPIQSINELVARFNPPKTTDVHVGHWFLNAELPGENKYWKPHVLRELFPFGQVFSLSADFTHHDSHVMSAMVFGKGAMPNRYHAAVFDGFGSFGECISLYEIMGGNYRLVHRVFGFEKSLGMLYQYATAFMGMKMHNHEYKMLAYEVHIAEHFGDDEMARLNQLIEDTSLSWLRRLHNPTLHPEFDPVINLEALPEIQANINKSLMSLLSEMGVSYDDTQTMRCLVSYFVQSVVQQVTIGYIRLVNPINLMVVGGLFYNVKLNSMLADMVKGRFCAMPLAGDQGAGLGVYAAHKGMPFWPESLAIGPRSLIPGIDEEIPEGIHYFKDMVSALDQITFALHTYGIVNLVRGNMEFGPRALCHTTTLAIPTVENAATINRINDRTMEMPFAPVMTEAQVEEFFEDTQKIVKSLDYMIITRKYREGKAEQMLGAAHRYDTDDGHFYTGRPQIARDNVIIGLLEKFGPLINTSFNFHGVPIVRSRADINFTHSRQRETAPDVKIPTIVVQE